MGLFLCLPQRDLSEPEQLSKVLTILIGVVLCAALFFCCVDNDYRIYSTMLVGLVVMLITVNLFLAKICLSFGDIIGLSFIVYCCIHTLYYRPTAFDFAIKAKIICFILLYLLSRFISAKDVIILLRFFVLLGALECVVCSHQLIMMGFHQEWKHSLTGTFANSSDLGVLLSITIVSSVYTIKNNEKKWFSLFSAIIAVFSLLFVFLSKSRTSILILCMVGFRLLLKGPWIKKAIIYLLCFTVILIVLYHLRPSSADSRLLTWEISLPYIVDSPFFGNGITSFQSQHMFNQAHYFSVNPASQYAIVANNNYQPFNESIRIIYELGIIGYFFGAFLIYHSVKNASEAKKCLVISVLLASMFINVLDMPIMACTFSCLLGAERKSIINLSLSKVGRFSSCLLLTCFLLSQVGTISRFYKIEEVIVKNQEFTSSNFSEKELEMAIHNKGLALLLSWRLNKQNDQWARSIVERISQETISTCEMLTDLGLSYQRSGLFNDAEKCLILASQMIPSKALPLYYLLELYLSTNNTEAAKTISSSILTRCYKKTGSIVVRLKSKAREVLDERWLHS